MKHISFLVIIIVSFSCHTKKGIQEAKPINDQNIITELDDLFILKDCMDPLVFAKNLELPGWQLKGRDWTFGTLNINSFTELTDSLMILALFNSFEITKYENTTDKTNGIEIGDFIIARNKARVNIRYVIKLRSQEGDKITLEYKPIRIANHTFFSLTNRDRFSHVIKYSDVKTLEELILEYGAEVNICENFTQEKISPLTYAMLESKKEIFNKLIDLGADINKGCRGNRTSLMYAVNLSDSYYFEKLLQQGAKPLIEDENGKTVHDYIAYYKKEELLKFLQ